MGDTDWMVWPIFIVQLFAFLLFFIKAKRKFLWIPIQAWVIVLILVANITIVISVAHDASSPLQLYF